MQPMRRRTTVTLLAIVAVLLALYAAYSLDLVGMIVRGHGGFSSGHSG
jgi:hypothetical protein